MKQLSGPYSAFEQYHPLEDAIELYNEIWYESSSSDEWKRPWEPEGENPEAVEWVSVKRMDSEMTTNKPLIDAKG